MTGANRHLRGGIRLVLGILLIGWLGGALDGEILSSPPLASARAEVRACTESDIGLDIVFLVDRNTDFDPTSNPYSSSYDAIRDATDSVILFLNARALLLRPTEQFSVATLVFNVDDQDDFGTNSDHVEAVRPDLEVPFSSSPEVLYDSERLYESLSWFGGKDRATLLWDIKAPFRAAQQHLPAGSQRPKLVIAMLNEFFASQAGNVYTSGLVEVGNEYKKNYGNTLSVFVLGFNSKPERLSEARHVYAPLLSTSQQPEQAIREVTAANLEATLLQILRDQLCTPMSSGTSMVEVLQGQSSFRVEPYQDSLSVFWFSVEEVSRLGVEMASGDFQSEKRIFKQRAWGLMTVPNPLPGTWNVSGISAEGKPLPPSALSLEIIQTAADKAFAVIVKDQSVKNARVGQVIELRWWMSDSHSRPLTYSDDTQRLQVNATLEVEGSIKYQLPLVDKEENGVYVGSFVAALPGTYEVIIEPRLKHTAETLTASVPNLGTLDLTETFTVEPIKVEVVSPPVLEQFSSASFKVELRDTTTGALVTDLNKAAKVTALIIVQDKPVRELIMQPGDSPAQFISEEVTLLYQDFTLEVQATLEDLNRTSQQIGEPIRLRLRAVPDPGSVRFTNSTPYVLQETQVEYVPVRLSPTELDALQLEVVAEVQEQIDDGTGALWRLPLKAEGDRYVAPFYASRAVPHALRLVGILKQTGEVVFTQDVSSRLNPSAVEIRYEGPTSLKQFETLRFDLTAVNQGQPVSGWSPSALAKLTVRAALEKGGVRYPLTLQGDASSGYSTSIKLDEHGTYNLAITAVVLRYPGASTGDPMITLPVTGASITCLPASASLRVVNTQGNTSIDVTQALMPVTLEFEVAADAAAMVGPAGEPPQATLWLIYPNQVTTEIFDSLSYDPIVRRFRVPDFIPVEPGAYRLEASLWRSNGNSTLFLLDREQITPYTFTVKPVHVCADHLDKRIYKPSETLRLHLWLCTPNGLMLSFSPAITPLLTLELREESVGIVGKWPGGRSYKPQGEHLAEYRIEGSTPAMPGKYSLEPSVVADDSSGNRSMLTFLSVAPLTFEVGEGIPLKLHVATADKQDSLTTRWLIEDEVPLIITFGVRTLSGEPVPLTPEELGCHLDACFTVQVRDENGKPVKGRLGAPKIVDPSQHTAQYSIYGLSQPWMGKRRFIIDLSFANPEQLKFPYVINSLNRVSSFEVSYGPELWKVLLVPSMIVLSVLVAGVLVYRWGWVIFAPEGTLYLVDCNDQEPLNPVKLTQKRNRYTIDGVWKIALVDRIRVASNWYLSRHKQLKVTVYYRGGAKGETHILQDGSKVRLMGTSLRYSLRYEGLQDRRR